VALKHTGQCMGGPYHGEEWTYFSEEMDVEELIGNPVQETPTKVKGTYKHDGKALWIWYGPTCKPRDKAPITSYERIIAGPLVPEFTREVVIQRLKELRDAKVGTPLPEWMAKPNNWGAELSKLAGSAVEYLKPVEPDVLQQVFHGLKNQIKAFEFLIEQHGSAYDVTHPATTDKDVAEWQAMIDKLWVVVRMFGGE
jgi:hypothetical protein